MRDLVIVEERHHLMWHPMVSHLSLWLGALLLALLPSTGTAQIFNALYEFQGGSDGGGPNGTGKQR